MRGAVVLCSFLHALASVAQTRLILDPGNTISTLAGTGLDAATVSGLASDAALGSPRGLVYDSVGNLYLADSRNHQIDRVTQAGALTTFGGTGVQGYAGDGGLATAAEFDSPTALALGSDGSLYVADSGNHCIRRITNGTITTVAGTGRPGFNGDGVTATKVQFRFPGGLAFGADGSLYIADTGNHRVRKVDSAGSVSTVAGDGTEGDTGDGFPAVVAALRAPMSLQMLPDGRLLIADRDARRIRVLLPDGTVNAYATMALRRPEGLGADAAGNLLIADAGNQQALLSGLDASQAVASTSVAGNGIQGELAAGGATASALDSPAAAVADTNGDIAISDRRNHQVQRVTLAALAFGDVPAGRVSAAQVLRLINGSQSELTVSAAQLPSGFTPTVDGRSCASTPFSLQPADNCSIGVAFSPIAQGQQRAFLQVQLRNAPAATVVLTGNGTDPGSLSASLTTLTSNGSISYAGTPVQFASSVSGTLGTGPIGNLTFLDGSIPLATVPLVAGSATLTTAALQTGQHKVRASYSGDAVYAASTSGDLTETVVAAPDFTITAAASSYSGSAGGGISIPISVLPVNGTLNHTVRLSVAGLPAGATALLTPSVFTLGGDPASVSLAITMPTTLSRNTTPNDFLAAACGIGGILLFASFKRFRREVRMVRSIGLLALVLTVAVCTGGCGGFRTTSTSTGSGPAANAFHYTAVVTATSTGIMGDALTHTATVGLVVTQ